MLKLMLAVAVVGVSVAERKCAKPSWRAYEGSLGLGLPQIHEQYKPLKERGRNIIYYDLQDQRIAIVSNISVNGRHGDFKIITDYKEGVRYIINEKENTCKVKEITRSFPELCIPEKATYLFDVQLGGAAQGGDTISAKAYFGEFEKLKGKVGVVMTVTSDRYLPVLSTQYGLGKHKFLMSTLFGNIAEPIPSDEIGVFTVPSICTSQLYQDEELHVFLGPVANMLLDEIA
ncbi:ependymin-1-like [Haliotis asinina]|uniref:ependymin-1-like n=1 Tax=Haliotis asinina TaxID=109174 RepID=UPI003531D223